MTPPTKTAEQQAFEERVKSACILMEDEPNLKLLRDRYLTTEARKTEEEALKMLKGAKKESQRIEAQALAIAAGKIIDFRDRITKMASDAKSERAAKPATTTP